MLTFIWIACIAGVLFYFYKKFQSVKADAVALNENVTLWQYVAKDILDILIALALAVAVLVYGDKLHEVLGLPVVLEINLASPFAAFLTGAGLAHFGVNAILSLLNLIPPVDLGNQARKSVREIADEKSNIADRRSR